MNEEEDGGSGCVRDAACRKSEVAPSRKTESAAREGAMLGLGGL